MFRIFALLLTLTLASQVQAQSEIQFQNNESQRDIKIEIFPNPTTEYLNIHVKGTDERPTFHLHNIIGNEVKVEFEKMGDNRYRINVENLAPGYYLLAIKEPTTKFSRTLKFLKR